MSIFGDYFKFLRVNNINKSINDLCKGSNIESSFLSKVERGVIVPNNIDDLVKLFGGSIEEREYNTLLELSKIKNTISFDHFSKNKKRKLIQETYNSHMISGSPLTWAEAEEKTKQEWSE